MKIALVHDYIKEYGGAERVLETLHEMYPDAPVFTSVFLPDYLGPHKSRFENWDIRTSVAQILPFKAKLISPLRLISPFLFKQFNFSEFDVIISSATGAYFPNSLHKKKAKLLCYCHTPPRYLYGYATARNWKRNPVLNIVGEIANHFLRMVDFSASKNVDQYIANSQEVAGRIKKFYRREAIVIYPPVTIQNSPALLQSHSRPDRESDSRFRGNDKKEYYLTGGRLARAKHVDVIVRACRELNVPLKVFGRAFGGYGKELGIENWESGQKGNHNSSFILPNSKVEFLGEVSDEEKDELMTNAKAFLFASEDEDFGMIPVEAMGYGLPVIAYKSGGVKETIVDPSALKGTTPQGDYPLRGVASAEGRSSGYVTGLFFDQLSADSLKDAIRKFAKMKIKSEDCRTQAEKFSKEIFQKKIRALLLKAT